MLNRNTKIALACAAAVATLAGCAGSMAPGPGDAATRAKALELMQAGFNEKGIAKLDRRMRRCCRPTTACRLLSLELMQWNHDQAAFDDRAIEYAIAFEMSPPSWEPPPPSLKTRAATPADKPVEVDDGMQWRGTVRGNGEPQFGRLLVEAKTEKRLAVDCTYLKRIEFATATSLLTLLTKLRQGGVTIEFRNVNHLIAALFSLLGVDMVADVQLRRV